MGVSFLLRCKSTGNDLAATASSIWWILSNRRRLSYLFLKRGSVLLYNCLSCHEWKLLVRRLVNCLRAAARTWDEVPSSLAGLRFSLRVDETFSIIFSSSCLLFDFLVPFGLVWRVTSTSSSLIESLSLLFHLFTAELGAELNAIEIEWNFVESFENSQEGW